MYFSNFLDLILTKWLLVYPPCLLTGSSCVIYLCFYLCLDLIMLLELQLEYEDCLDKQDQVLKELEDLVSVYPAAAASCTLQASNFFEQISSGAAEGTNDRSLNHLLALRRMLWIVPTSIQAPVSLFCSKSNLASSS